MNPHPWLPVWNVVRGTALVTAGTLLVLSVGAGVWLRRRAR